LLKAAGTLIAAEFQEKTRPGDQTSDNADAGTPLLSERFLKVWTEKVIAPRDPLAG